MLSGFSVDKRLVSGDEFHVCSACRREAVLRGDRVPLVRSCSAMIPVTVAGSEDGPFEGVQRDSVHPSVRVVSAAQQGMISRGRDSVLDSQC